MSSPPFLEPEVLQRLSRLAEEARRLLVVVPLRREVALCHPGRGAVTCGRKLFETRLCGVEDLLRLIEAALLQHCASEHELRVADLVQIIDAAREQLQRMPRLLLRLHHVAG